MGVASPAIRPLLLPTSPHHPPRFDLSSRFLFPATLSSLNRLPAFPRLSVATPRSPPRFAPVVASAQSNFLRVIQSAWRVGKDGIDAGTNLVPDTVPKPIARILVAGVAATVALFLLKSIISTAFFVLAMMGFIYFAFRAFNADEGPRGGGGSSSSSEEETLEEARRIMEKYK